MVSVLAIYSDDPSLNTARVCSFYSVKEATDGHLKSYGINVVLMGQHRHLFHLFSVFSIFTI